MSSSLPGNFRRVAAAIAGCALLTLCVTTTLSADSEPTTKPSTSPVRIVLVGDSTVATSSGWGPGFQRCVQPGAECLDLAKNGASSKSFRAAGLWKKAMDAKPNYVLIQFGHNDMPGKGPERETDPATTYSENMARFVDEARAAGAIPILVTSMPRRHFTPEGTIKSDLVDYVEAVKKVAADKKVPLLDLHRINIELLNKLGPSGSADWNPTIKRKQGDKEVEGPDTTHLTRKASDIVGKQVADELKKIVPELAPSLK